MDLNRTSKEKNKIILNEQKIRLLDDFQFQLANKPLINRYLFYCLLQNNDVEISWIERETTDSEGDDVVQPPSPYIQLLQSVFGLNIDTHSRQDIEDNVPRKSDAFALQVKQLTAQPLALDTSSSIADTDWKLCRRRYFYSYILNDFQSFHSSFSYSFLLSKCITSVNQHIGPLYNPNLNLREENDLLTHFPSLSLIEKYNILTYIITTPLPAGVMPHMIHFLHLFKYNNDPNRSDFQIIGRTITITDRTIRDKKHKKPSEKCMCCPYSDGCSEKKM